MTGPRFDPDALRAKYRAERDKRLRPDGIAQYVELTGKFAHFERFTVNFPYVIDLQAKHVAHLVERALREGIAELEASQQAEDEWVATVVAVGNRTTEFSESCTPGYYNAEGRADARLRQGAFFFGGPTEFAERLAAWRAEGSMQGLETRRSRS